MKELVASALLIALGVSGAAYAFGDRPRVYKDKRTGRYIIPRSRTTRDGERRHHD